MPTGYILGKQAHKQPRHRIGITYWYKDRRLLKPTNGKKPHKSHTITYIGPLPLLKAVDHVISLLNGTPPPYILGDEPSQNHILINFWDRDDPEQSSRTITYVTSEPAETVGQTIRASLVKAQ